MGFSGVGQLYTRAGIGSVIACKSNARAIQARSPSERPKDLVFGHNCAANSECRLKNGTNCTSSTSKSVCISSVLIPWASDFCKTSGQLTVIIAHFNIFYKKTITIHNIFDIENLFVKSLLIVFREKLF
jgi:hypothetical protein